MRFLGCLAMASSLACGGSSGSDAAPAPRPLAAPTFECGTLRPNLYSYCIDGTPPRRTSQNDDAEQPLTAGPDGFSESVRIKACDLGITPGDPGLSIEADLAVSCVGSTVTASSTAFDVTFDGHATRRCAPGEYGSGAGTKPYWKGSLALPGDGSTRYRITVTADVGSDLSHGCTVMIDGQPGLPLYSGSSQPVAASFASAGATVVTLDCTAGDGLAATGCQGFTAGQAVSPVDVTTHLHLEIGATRCDGSGC
jgi:hypothetical protein